MIIEADFILCVLVWPWIHYESSLLWHIHCSSNSTLPTVAPHACQRCSWIHKDAPDFISEDDLKQRNWVHELREPMWVAAKSGVTEADVPQFKARPMPDFSKSPVVVASPPRRSHTPIRNIIASARKEVRGCSGVAVGLIKIGIWILQRGCAYLGQCDWF